MIRRSLATIVSRSAIRETVGITSAASVASRLQDNYCCFYGVTLQSPASAQRQCQYFSTRIEVVEPIPLPANLKIDPKSSFLIPHDDDVEVEYDNLPPVSSTRQASDDEEEENEIDEADAESFLYPDEIVYAKPLPERLNVDVYTLFAPEHSSHVGTIWLDSTVFGCDPIRVDLLKRAVDYYRNKKRGVRTAKTKTIAEVSGSGRKLRPQKGMGKARVGHSRPPHFRGGAKAHGPKNVTDYGNTKLNKKVRKLALRNALSQKLKEGNLLLLNELHPLPTHKTRDLVRLLEPWGIAQGRRAEDSATALILDHYYNDDDEKNETKAATSYNGVPVNLWVASSNLYQLKVGNHHKATVHDILKHEKLVITLAALEQLEARLKE